MLAQQWVVVTSCTVGSADGSIPVQVSRGLNSATVPEGLRSGAVLEERELVDDRLRFRKLSGIGPLTGWVTVGIHHDGALQIKRGEQTVDGSQEISSLLEGNVASVPTDSLLAGVAVNMETIRRGALSTSRMALGRRRPASLAQWYNELRDERPVVDHGVTTIKWTSDGQVWYNIEESWVVHQQANDAQIWDLNEMDLASGVEMECLDPTRSERTMRSCSEHQPSTTFGIGGCIRCLECARPPGHSGSCFNSIGVELIPAHLQQKQPSPGVYVGLAKDVTCPGDDVGYEIILRGNGACTLSCAPKLSLFAGGQPPWSCTGAWTYEEGFITVCVTKQDFKGPKEDDEIQIAVALDGKSITFKNTVCAWQRKPSLPHDFDLSGWWKLTPVGDGGDIVHFVFHHEPRSKTFTGNQKDFDAIHDGLIDGELIQWEVDVFTIKGKIESDGQRLVELQVRSNVDSDFTVTYNGEREAAPPQGLCAICLDDFAVEEKLRTLPCEHHFHTDCIEQWLSVSSDCPVCRSSVLHS